MNNKTLILIKNYIKNNEGKLYAPIPHPMFEGFECTHTGRAEVIRNKIKEINNLKTGLDIGSHWGEMCYVLEDMGIQMTAIEKRKKTHLILNDLKNDLNRKFNVILGSVFSLDPIKFDIILALNIFHHFIKKKRIYNKWIDMLQRLECKVMFFQAHNPNEGQMLDAYKNFDSTEFVKVILQNSCLNEAELILDGKRPIFMLTT